MINESSRLFSTVWSNFGQYRVPSIRDDRQRVAQPFTDYLDSVAAKHHSNQKLKSAALSDMQAKAYALRLFAEFLTVNRWRLFRVNDEILQLFKTSALDGIQSSKSTRGLEHQQRESASVKLRAVYDFLFWCQSELILPANTLGWDEPCRVRSSLVLAKTRGNEQDRKPANKYPLCFYGRGEGRAGAQHWASVAELDHIETDFWEARSALTATRNSLMLRLLDSQAWRISSANSLTVQQFSEDALLAKSQDDEFTVTPPNQKGGKSFSFRMSWELARHIQQYCSDDEVGRIAIMKQRGVDEKVAMHAVFLSMKSGGPLSRHSWVTIFARGFRQAGAPKGAGGHAIRRKRAEEEMETEIEYRLEHGLPVTLEAVSAAVQEKLGHSTAAAGRSYRRVMRNLRRKSRQERLAKQLEETQLEVARLRSHIAVLEGRGKS